MNSKIVEIHDTSVPENGKCWRDGITPCQPSACEIESAQLMTQVAILNNIPDPNYVLPLAPVNVAEVNECARRKVFKKLSL